MIDYTVRLNLKTICWQSEAEATLNLPVEWITLELKSLCWQSDFNGEDCGYDTVSVIGSYSNQYENEEWCYYIDMDTMELLEFWKLEEDY